MPPVITSLVEPMARKVPILSKRVKGPVTPNFSKVSHMLEGSTKTAFAFDKEKVSDQHGGIGIKMSFVCDILENIESLYTHEKKAFYEGMTLFINQEVFFGLILNLDIFVFELYSILDYLAVELSEIFELKVRKRGVLKDVENFMELKNAEGLNPSMKQMVNALIKQPWFDYFHRLRNRVTHRMPVNFLAHVKYENGKIVKFEYPFLPDNPDKITSTFDLKLNLVNEPKKWIEGIFGFVDGVCGALISLLNVS